MKKIISILTLATLALTATAQKVSDLATTNRLTRTSKISVSVPVASVNPTNTRAITFANIQDQISQELNLEFATNAPTRGFGDTATIGPDMVVEWYYCAWYDMPYGFMTNVNFSYYTNVGLYVDNMTREFKTNGYYAAGWRGFCFDDYWMQPPDGSGHLKPNTNLFEGGALALSLKDLVKLGQSRGFKMLGYTALTTNGCGPDVSPIDRAYTHTWDLMELGFDGAKYDHCGALSTETNSYYARYFRIVDQAISDYYAMVGATNGTCRPFKKIVTGSAGEEWPNTVNTDFSFGVNQFQIQPGIIHFDTVSVGPWGYPGITNGMNMLRDVLQFRPFFRPGRVVYHGIGVYGNAPTCYWTNMIATAVLACQPIEAGLGSRNGKFDSTDQWKTDFFPLYSQFLTNGEVFEMHADRLVVPCTITHSNSLLEVMNRPLFNGDVCLGIANLSITNKNNLTLTVDQMDLRPGVAYVARNPWSGAETKFTNSLTLSQGPESISLFRVRKDNFYLTAASNSLSVIWPTKSLTVSGTGFSALSYGTALSPWTAVEGLFQSAGNNTAEFAIPVPKWANSVEMVASYYSSFAGTVVWTNRPFLRYASPTGTITLDADFDPVAYPEHVITCLNGTLTKTTNVFTFPATNSVKYISLQWKAGTNASSRAMVGAPEFRFY